AQATAVVVDRAVVDGGNGDDHGGDGQPEQPAQGRGDGQGSCSFRFRRGRPPAALSRRNDGMSAGNWQEQWTVDRGRKKHKARSSTPRVLPFFSPSTVHRPPSTISRALRPRAALPASRHPARTPPRGAGGNGAGAGPPARQ